MNDFDETPASRLQSANYRPGEAPNFKKLDELLPGNLSVSRRYYSLALVFLNPLSLSEVTPRQSQADFNPSY